MALISKEVIRHLHTKRMHKISATRTGSRRIAQVQRVVATHHQKWAIKINVRWARLRRCESIQSIVG